MASHAPTLRRLRVEVGGAVQGVGFRPFVYRLATDLGLNGWVVNDVDGVRVEVEGAEPELEAFLARLRAEAPPRAVVGSLDATWLDPQGLPPFEIRRSARTGDPRVTVLPDLATCPACLQEVLDPEDRRHQYAFTNCTDCGPRFSIIRDLPYDRPATTMASFAMCEACEREYTDPSDRRFHAQPNACPSCGPQVWLHPSGPPRMSAIEAAARCVRAGEILAVRGIGGFHLICDATNQDAVMRLRERKRRPTKPLAVMVPDIDAARALCDVSDEAAALLTDPAAPIVLMPRAPHGTLAPSVAPGAPRLGLFLPYTPLHHLLLAHVDGPVVATSGNLSDEPICTDNAEAQERLADIADRFLLHDRPIERPVDDSVVAEMGGTLTPMRRSRGYAPMPLPVAAELPPILAVGGQQKSAIALGRGTEAWLGAHIGDLSAPETQDAFRRSIDDLTRLYRIEPELVAHDLHPDYTSTRWALDDAGPVRRVAVQHHHAHLASLLGEHGLAADADPVLGIVWDGSGLGPDGTIWGGEWLLGTASGYERVAHLRTFRLPGGEAAIRDPRRTALALLIASGLDPALAHLPEERSGLLTRMIETGLSSPVTSSMGRLFDGVAALLGLAAEVTWEGEAAVALEALASTWRTPTDPAPFDVLEMDSGGLSIDWRPAVRYLVHGRQRGVPAAELAEAFHQGLVTAAVEVARRIGVSRVGLSGGCMQNTLLVGQLRAQLAATGHETLMHRIVPPNDGGLALGQLLVAAAAPSPDPVV